LANALEASRKENRNDKIPVIICAGYYS
jgi:hypothetical protein